MNVKKFFTVLSIATLFLIGFSFSIVRAEDTAKYASSDKAEYKEVIPGLSKSVLWGDPDKGAYGAFTKMAPGFDAGMHTHTNNVWIVVHKGAYLYKDSAGEKRVGPGDFIWVPAGHKHWSGADKKEGAIFYEESNGKFDVIPVK
jgi:quercetin dioxygenase-like cupin family protein